MTCQREARTSSLVSAGKALCRGNSRAPVPPRYEHQERHVLYQSRPRCVQSLHTTHPWPGCVARNDLVTSGGYASSRLCRNAWGRPAGGCRAGLTELGVRARVKQAQQARRLRAFGSLARRRRCSTCTYQYLSRIKEAAPPGNARWTNTYAKSISSRRGQQRRRSANDSGPPPAARPGTITAATSSR